ncbi:caspase family protein [Actinokineospora auranticolor]|uniref:Caspase domain-containing protein n=1 Tax=Actinokineospora auranticolor TaxID=155976 RepID=A0A2S6H102_9PSEU|nr:caspase family protein [Actinokineospora auranticolor]PPK71100.1 caspase domain-containing protein [Actinokineospora auranticolor]
MTFFDQPGDGPRTHALVIGVGRYPHCEPGSGHAHLEAALARRFGGLTAPPASAVRVAEWLVTAQRADPIAPLGSVELLASDTPGTDAPTFEAVRAAFDRWYARCDSHEDNVALFFFSGHGCAGTHQLALLEDLGAVSHRFFANAIDIDRFVDAMAKCRARTQCFFVDACRTTPPELLTMSGVDTNVLLQPSVHRRAREMCTIFATEPQTEALGVAGGTTIFTEALLAALDGAAAVRRDATGPWCVETGRIAPAVNSLLAWQGERRQRCSPRTEGTGSQIRQLPADPRVPFQLGCDPREALGVAELCLRDPRGGPEQRRGPRPALWQGTGTAGIRTLCAEFPGGEYEPTVEYFALAPPHLRFDLPVTRREEHHGHR